jgi:beta-glucosidase
LLWMLVYNVSVTITNAGDRAGHEVVQLYMDVAREWPPQVLEFQKVYLERGNGKVVTTTLLRRDVSVWSPEKQDCVGAAVDRWGRGVGVWVGARSRGLRVEGRNILL